ncbi:hypothetical protein [Hymenobacter arizonensis]|nr:hypothetical protein [Hymenobacter arizonensis]
MARLLRLSGLEEYSLWWAGDLVVYIMPPPTSRFLHGEWAASLYNNGRIFNMPGSLENTLFMGFALPLLAVGLWALRVRRARPTSQRFNDPEGLPLAWVLVVFLIFTVPTFRILGHEMLNMPTAAIPFIPFFNNIRCPTRWIMMVGLLLPIVSFSALEAWWKSRLKPITQVLFTCFLAAVILLKYWPQPYQFASKSAIPRAFRMVADLPGTTVVPIPLGILDGYRQVGHMETEQMFYQTVHEKKLPTGYLSRVSPTLFASLDAEPVLRALLSVQVKPDTVLPAHRSSRYSIFCKLISLSLLSLVPPTETNQCTFCFAKCCSLMATKSR